jgi:hypothetical protein
VARKVLTNLDLTLNQLQNALAQVLASDPGSPTEGQFWYDSTNKVWKFRTNTATISLGRLDQISPPTADVSLNTHKLTGVVDGTADSDAATVGQMNAISRGMDWKASVRAATTTNGTLATAYANGSVIDGVTLVTGDRILLKDQTTAADNGIYTVNASGAPTRATDADSSAEVTGGLTVWVNEGTANGDKSYTLTTDNPITLGTTSLVFTQTGSPASAGGVAKFSSSIGNGSLTSFTVTHSLGTLDVIVQIFDNGTGSSRSRCNPCNYNDSYCRIRYCAYY